MPHDANGEHLQVGDRVYIPATVKEVYGVSDGCNLNLEFDIPMPCHPDYKDTYSAINAAQVVKDPTNITYKVLGGKRAAQAG